MATPRATADRSRLVGLCVSFGVLFAAYYGAQTQVTPTLGVKLGSLSLALLYACLAATAPLAPALLRRLGRGAARDSLTGETRALAVASLMYVPFMLACSEKGQRAAQLGLSALLGCAAALLWVAEGSLLTASTTAANRGRWSGIFWATFMAGNAAGNLSAALVIDATSVAMLFRVMGAVGALGSVCFAVLVRPRRAAAAGSAAGDLAAPLVTAPLVAARLSDGGGNELSLGRDLRELGRAFCRAETAALLPLLCFIGAENSFWSGEFPALVSRLGGDEAASLAISVLAATEIATSVAAGVAVDRGWPVLGLSVALAAFVGALGLVQLDLVPRQPQRNATALALGPNGLERAAAPAAALPWTAFLAAALMGVGDAAANTIAVARLGNLADEHGLIRREAAFTLFQCVNVAVSSAAFVYAPAMPLDKGAPPLQPAILGVLALLAVASFAWGARGLRARPERGIKPAGVAPARQHDEYSDQAEPEPEGLRRAGD